MLFSHEIQLNSLTIDHGANFRSGCHGQGQCTNPLYQVIFTHLENDNFENDNPLISSPNILLQMPVIIIYVTMDTGLQIFTC